MVYKYKENNKTIARYSEQELLAAQDKTDWQCVLSMTDSDIKIDKDNPDVSEMLSFGTAKISHRGRPKKANPKQLVSIRIDADTLRTLRATGSGWQTRLSEHISRWAMSL